MPNMVGGYMPGGLGEPAGMPWDKEGMPNTMFRALQHGCVVVTPAIRGRVLRNKSGEYIGKVKVTDMDWHEYAKNMRI